MKALVLLVFPVLEIPAEYSLSSFYSVLTAPVSASAEIKLFLTGNTQSRGEPPGQVGPDGGGGALAAGGGLSGGGRVHQQPHGSMENLVPEVGAGPLAFRKEVDAETEVSGKQICSSST